MTKSAFSALPCGLSFPGGHGPIWHSADRADRGQALTRLHALSAVVWDRRSLAVCAMAARVHHRLRGPQLPAEWSSVEDECPQRAGLTSLPLVRGARSRG